jgi:hypothetical protein
MTKVTVNKPEQAQVQVSSNTVQSVFTTTEPELRTIVTGGDSTTVNLEGNTSVAVAGSLASVINYFSALDLDFASSNTSILPGTDPDTAGEVKFGAESVRISRNRRGSSAPDYIQMTNPSSYVWFRNENVKISGVGGKFNINGVDTTIKLENLINWPNVSSADAGKVLTVNVGGDAYEFKTPASGGGGGGASTFSALTDTPSTLTPDKFLKVNSSGSALEFDDIPNIPEKITDLINDSDFASKLYVDGSITNLIDAAPGTLDTLNELAEALGDDPNFAATITTQLNNKADKSTLSTVATTGQYQDVIGIPDDYFYIVKRDEIVTKSYIDSLRVDADTLDRRDRADFFQKNDPDFPALLSELSDVDTSGKLNGQVLVYRSNTDSFHTGSALESISLGGVGNVKDDVDFAPVNYVLKSTGSGEDRWISSLINFSEIENTPTTISGYGITDAFDGNYENLSNKPSLFDGDYNSLSNSPNNVSHFTNDALYQNLSQVDQTITNKITASFINDLNVNASTLNGFSRTNLYQNLTGIPTSLSEFTNDTQYQNPSQVDTSIVNTVTKEFVEALGVAEVASANTSLNSLKLGDELPSYYLDYDNFTNIPINVSEFTNDSGYQNSSQVTTQILNEVDKNYIESFSIDAASLGGRLADHYLDYNQLINKPFGGKTSLKIEDLSDVSTLDPQVGMVLKWDGVEWIPDFDIGTQPQQNNNTTDALTLQGYAPAEFFDYENQFGAPTKLSQFTNDRNYQSDTDVEQRIIDTITPVYLSNMALDAGTLDSEDGSFYLDYDNFNNTPQNLSEFTNDENFANTIFVTGITDTKANTIMFSTSAFTGAYSDVLNTPQNLSDFTNDLNFQTDVEVTTTVNTIVNQSFINGLNVDAETLDGASKSDLLDYNLHTNTPTIPSTLDDLSDVIYSGSPTVGYVLKWNGTGWIGAPVDTDVDAAKLDGEDSSFYRDYNNLNANVPTSLSDFTNDLSLIDFTNDASLATETYVDTKVADVVNSSPGTLDTLNELAQALGDDANFSTTITNQIASKANTSMLHAVSTSGSYNDLIDTPQNLSDFSNDSGYQIASEVSTAISTGITNTVTKNFVESFNINSKTLDHVDTLVTHANDNITTQDGDDISLETSGIKNSDYFLNYVNFNNTPQNLSDFNNDFINKNFIDSLNINADKLDGESGTYFLDYANFINEPDVSIFNNDADYTNTAQVNTQITNTVTKEFVEDLGITGGGSGSGNFTGFSNTIQVGVPATDFGQYQLEDGASVTLNSTTTVAEALDILNETILNIRNQTYVRDAKYNYSVTSDASGHAGHLHSPVTISFTDNGDYTLASPQHTWTFSTSSGDQTSSSTNPTFTWDESAGGTFTIKHRVEAGGAGVQYPGSAGSWSEHTENITISPPLPVPDFTADDTSIDLDGSGTLVTFTDNSLFSNMYMWDMGDGTVYPTGAVENDPYGFSPGNTPWLTTSGITHTYTGSVDTQFTVKLNTFHTDHAQSASDHCIQKVKTNYIGGYVPISPTFSSTIAQGNNQDSNDTVHGVEGHFVSFTNNTAGVGNFGQFFEWEFHDSTTTYIKTTSGSTSYTDSALSGSGQAGDYNVAINRYFARDNTSAPATETYDVILRANNGHSNSPFDSSPITITVNKDPRSIFSYAMKNNPTGHSNYNATNIGFNFTGYDGLDYNIVTFSDSSENSSTNYWDFDNSISGGVSAGGWATSVPGADIDNQYTIPNTYSVKMISYGSTSEDDNDDTELKNNIIIINSTPTAPANLTGRTISLPSSSGLNPAMCNGTTINTTESAPSPGDIVKRLELTQVETSVTDDWANEFPSNGDYVGSVTAMVNGSADGEKTFSTSLSNLGSSGSILVTYDVDSNSLSSQIYPLNFYRQFKAKISKTNLSAGYNTYQISHSDGSSTNIVGWVQDDLTSVPNLASYNIIGHSDGNLRYVSGVPYFNTGGKVQITSLEVSNLTSQTYNKTNDFITVQSDTGSIASTQTYDYNDALGVSIPNAGLIGLTSINNLVVDISGSGVGIGTIKTKAVNVEGESNWRSNTKQIKYWYSTPTFNENNMTALDGTLKRVDLGLTGSTPSYTPADFYNTASWNSQTSLVGTDEAVMTPDGIKHDETDYSTFLPVGPDYSSGRSGAQYITLAFKKAFINKFAINITGSVSGGYIAVPGHPNLDYSSSNNGWFPLTVEFAGFGTPGSVSPPSGAPPFGISGTDGVVKGGSPVLQVNTNTTQKIEVVLGQAGTSDSTSGSYSGAYSVPYTILIRLELSSGQSITSLSVSEGA